MRFSYKPYGPTGKRIDIPWGLSSRAHIWVVAKVNGTLVCDGVLEFVVFVRTQHAGKYFYTHVVEESGIDRLALDPVFFQSPGIVCPCVTNYRF
jgi:hypothetical protein